MVIKIISTVIFILGFIVSFKDYRIMFQIIGSRMSCDNVINIKNKKYSVQGKAWKVLLITSLSLSVLLVTLFTIVIAWCYPESQFLMDLLLLLLPLNYSLEFSKVGTSTIKKFVSECLSIEDMKKFESACELKRALKDRKQYLSEDEAEELNKFYFDSKNFPRDVRIIFHSGAYEKAMAIRERRGYDLL